MNAASEYIKEACVEGIYQAIQAENFGADRIELCANLDVGGTTPDPELIEKVVKQLRIPVRVMIRPRGGNFFYSDAELQQMKSEMDFCKRNGVEAVVFGFLDVDNGLDINRIKEFTALASPMKVVVHKAIDETPNITEALKQLFNVQGISTILTSGGAISAEKGKETLKDMLQLSQGKIEVMPAGGITDKNIGTLHNFLNAKVYHGKGIVGDLK